MHKKATLIIAAGLCAALSTASFAALKDFTVNGEKVTAADQKKVLDQLVAKGAPNNAETEKLVKDKFIEQKALLQAAKDKGRIEKLPEYKELLEVLKNDLLVRVYINDYLKKHPETEAELKAVYDKQKKDYGDQEMQLRVITTDTEDQAKAILEKLGKGANFAALAASAKPSNNPAGAGLTNWTSTRAFVPPIKAEVEKLEVGQYVKKPIEVGGKYNVVFLEGKRKALFPSYDSLKPQIRKAVAEQKVRKHVDSLIKKAKVQ